MEVFHFSEKDWQGATPPCHSTDIKDELLDKLEYARCLCGFPFTITSAYRSKDYELSKGRKGTSAHCLGLAVDIACYDDERRLLLVQNLLRAGFTRIGIGSTFVHADVDKTRKPSMWTYY